MLTQQDVIAWHRDQAKLHSEVADRLEGKPIKSLPAKASAKAALAAQDTESEETQSITVTPEALEARVAEKTGRIKDLAAHFKVNETAIYALVSQPDSKVMIGDRGWLKIKQ